MTSNFGWLWYQPTIYYPLALISSHVFIALSGLALACFAAKAVFNAQSVDAAARPTSPAKARRVELREKLLRAQAVPPADAPPPPHQWSGGELDDVDVEVDAPSPVRLPEAPAAPRP